MLNGLSHLLPSSYNQSDRIQGMARYMNREGANSEVMTLLLIFAFMLSVILLLKFVSGINEKKRKEALRKRMEKRKAEEAGKLTKRSISKRPSAKRLR
jgi:hypothetical protein